MAYFIGSRELKEFYVGDQQIKRLYQGNSLIYKRPEMRPWTPADFGTALGCWFDCTDSSKMTLGSGNVVSRLNSVNDSGIYATPYTAANSVFRAAGYDSFAPYIQLSLSSLSSNYIGSANPKSVWSVTGQPSSLTSSTEGMCFGIANSGNTRFYFGVLGTGSYYRIHCGFANLADQISDYPATSPNNRPVISVVSHNSGLQVNAHLDGMQVLQVTAANGTVGRDSNFLLGYSTVSRQTIKETGYYNGVISDSDRKKLEGYLAHKYGTQKYLPADHPYKAEPPTISDE